MPVNLSEQPLVRSLVDLQNRSSLVLGECFHRGVCIVRVLEDLCGHHASSADCVIGHARDEIRALPRVSRGRDARFLCSVLHDEKPVRKALQYYGVKGLSYASEDSVQVRSRASVRLHSSPLERYPR